MYRFYINNVTNDYHYSELVRVFLNNDEFELILIDLPENTTLPMRRNSFFINQTKSDDRDTIKRELYRLLSDITGETSKWGTLTGVRPLNLAMQAYDCSEDFDYVKKNMKDKYLLSEEKLNLLNEILEYQVTNIKKSERDSVSIYLGIPFCPTKCAYCSFTSYVADEDVIETYLKNLFKEIEYTAEQMKKSQHNTNIESIYVGGGTPTTLNSDQIRRLINKLNSAFDFSNIKEITIEAGRPDTINEEKLKTIKECGVDRISINPQTMKDRTLEIIGRDHTSEDIRKAYQAAEKVNFNSVNADIIAGLPEEDIEDFKKTLDEVIALNAEDITVHTLSIKRGSRLEEADPHYYRKKGKVVNEMLLLAHKKLKQNGYIPYYIYRQKHQAGALENIGYCRQGKHCFYNVRIMEEKQTIIALGAGAIGKRYFPDEGRHERIANVSNYKIYNERIDEMLQRKNEYFGG